MNQTTEGVQSYLKTSVRIQQKYLDVLLSNVQVEKDWNILDLGCGTGNGTIKLANMVGPNGKVIALDPIPRRIELAKEKHYADNIEYHIAYGQDAAQFGKEKFDLVVAGTVMHWVSPEEKPKVFESVFESLKSGGIFLFNSMVSIETVSTYPIYGFLKDQNLVSYLRSKFYTTTIARYEELALQAGFVESVGKTKEMRIYFESVEPILYYIASSLHLADFDEMLNELRAIMNNDKIDKKFLYDEQGRAYDESEYIFMKCRKQ